MDKIAAIQSFLSQFLPAYEENAIYSAPTKPAFPYITYEGIFSRYNEDPYATTYMTVTTWYREAGRVNSIRKTAEMSAAIPQNGVRIPVDDGVIVIAAASDPFGSPEPEPSDDLVKKMVHTLSVTFFTLN